MPSDVSTEFAAREVADILGLWRSTAGTWPARALRIGNDCGIVAMFPPVAAWELGPPPEFDLVYPVGTVTPSLLDLPTPWHASAVSDFFCHVFDASQAASPQETILTTLRCFEALGFGPRRLRATAVVPEGELP